MQFVQQQNQERPFTPTHGDDLFFGRAISLGRSRRYPGSRITIDAFRIFSLASFSSDCYIAAMSDGQTGGNDPSTEIRDDGALLRAVAARDKEAFQQIYTRHSPMLFGLAVKILGDRTEAEDVLQETFIQVWKTAASFDDQRGKPLAWFIMLIRSRAIDRLRSRKTRTRLTETANKEETQITTARTPADDAVTSEAQRTVRDALGKLPEDQRIPIEMAYFGGLTQFEIAQRLSQPLGTVKTRIRAGMSRLREQLGSVTAGKGGHTP
jgi:RNA polymerase sigma-70 factor, ECF subfamily